MSLNTSDPITVTSTLPPPPQRPGASLTVDDAGTRATSLSRPAPVQSQANGQLSRTRDASALTQARGLSNSRLVRTRHTNIDRSALPAPATFARLDVADVLMRVHVRDGLLEAVACRDHAAVQTWLRRIPPEVTDLTTYLPAVPTNGGHGLAEHVAWTDLHTTPHAPIDRLSRYLEAGGQRAQMAATRDADMARYLGMEGAYDANVHGICLAMDTIHETRLRIGAPVIEALMETALRTPRLAQHLAEQPFANLQVLLHKCVLLQTHMADKTLAAFCKAVENALVQQQEAPARLCNALLQNPFDEREVKRLALQDYARLITASPIEPLGSSLEGTKVDELQRQLETLHSRVDAWITRLVRAYDSDTTDAEIVALRSVRARLQASLDLLL